MGKSINASKQEKLEKDTLRRAILLSKGKKKRTRDILSYLNGTQIIRTRNDKPDIVVLQPNEGKGNETIIGIEHFLVEQVSEKKGNKTKSIIHEKRHYLDSLLSDQSGKASDEDLSRKINDIIFDIIAQTNSTGIPEMKEAFFTTFRNHLGKVHEYRENLFKLAEGKQIKLAFLIEIHCHADDVFLNNGKTVNRRTNTIYPIFSWMVQELETINPNTLEYVILYWKDSINGDEEDVLAFDTDDIKGSLRKQGVIVYDYCNDPARLSFDKLSVDEKSMQYTIEVQNKDTYSDDLMPILQKSYEFRRNSIPFVAPRSIQAMIYANGKAKFRSYESKIIMISEFTKKDVLKRFDSFVASYPIQKQNDMDQNDEEVRIKTGDNSNGESDP